jgi:hypothetical protein
MYVRSWNRCSKKKKVGTGNIGKEEKYIEIYHTK